MDSAISSTDMRDASGSIFFGVSTPYEQALPVGGLRCAYAFPRSIPHHRHDLLARLTAHNGWSTGTTRPPSFNRLLALCFSFTPIWQGCRRARWMFVPTSWLRMMPASKGDADCCGNRWPLACRCRGPGPPSAPRRAIPSPAPHRSACARHRRLGLHRTLRPGELHVLELSGSGHWHRPSGSRTEDGFPSRRVITTISPGHVPHNTRSDDVQRTGFRRQYVASIRITQHQQADTERIAAADHPPA